MNRKDRRTWNITHYNYCTTMSSTNGNTAASAITTVDTVEEDTVDAVASTTSPTERQIKSRTLLEEVEEALAHSLLVFLVADLRLMSATGRIETKYETIAIASDPLTRSRAVELAGLQPDLPMTRISESLVKHQEEGLSPAQIMAVLIIELKKTVEARRKEEERQRAERGTAFVGAKRTADAFKDETFAYFQPDKSGNLKIQAKEEDMHSLLRAYADMIGQDMKGEVPHIARRISMMNWSLRSSSGPTTGQRQNQLSSIIEEENDESTENLPIGQTVGEAVGRAATQAMQPLQQRAEAMRQSIMAGGPLIKDQETITNEQFGEVTDALFNMGGSSSNLNERIGDSGTQQSLTQEELLTFMEKAVESRVYGKLDFLADFFRGGTVSKLMAESNARVVWMNDWYPLKVC